MANVAYSKDQLGFVVNETTFGTIPSISNSNAFKATSLVINASPALIDQPDKTGSLDFLLGAKGRKAATWSMKCAARGNGAAGTAPDVGPFFQALFGQAPTIVASTSVTYTLADLSPSLSIYSFRKPSTVTQQVALGAVVDTFQTTFGPDTAYWEFGGTALWGLSTDEFSTADTTAKGGLSSFPSQPSSPVTNGSMIVGFLGSITIDGVTYTTSANGGVRSASLSYKANRDIPNDIIGSGYGSSPAQDRRDITGTIDLYDDDSSALSALKVKAINATSINMVFVMGNVAGNIMTVNLNNCQLTPATYDDGQRKYAAKFNFKAHASGLGTLDSITIAFT